jgi:hypothetical protein
MPAPGGVLARELCPGPQSVWIRSAGRPARPLPCLRAPLRDALRSVQRPRAARGWKTGAVRALTASIAAALIALAPATGAAAAAPGRAAPAKAAQAAPWQAAPAEAQTSAATVCTATDSRLIGLSGLGVTAGGYVAISDSNVDKSAIRIFYLDSRCGLVRSVGYPTSAYDPEDLAIGRDGTLYVADIGDNGRTRSRIAIWRVPPGGTPKIFRYAYPDGAHDAEALLLAADDTPIIVTKDPLSAGIYTPTGPADQSGAPVALHKVGSFRPSATGTPSGVGVLGQFVVTGGANSADRGKVALRTYSDAYEWPVPDGDVVKAITTGKPRITPLPDEPQGESIGYAPDGASFLTISDQEDHPVSTPILRYPSALAGPTPTPAGGGSASPAASRTGTPAATRPARHDRPAPWPLVAALAGVAVLGASVTGVTFARRRRR